MTHVENKTAYPYITQFKKEPFISFAMKKSADIKSFFLSNYEKLLNICRYWNENLLSQPNLDLEQIFWFLLLKKYLKQNISTYKEEIYNFIIKCEVDVIEKDQLGFKLCPNSTSIPDIWSLYYALMSLNTLGAIEDYLFSRGSNENSRRILNFINDHVKSNTFSHCLDKKCEKCHYLLEEQTLYYILELQILLGIDVRLYKERYKSTLTEKKKDMALIFKLLSLKFLELEFEVKEKAIDHFHQIQKSDGGYSFNSEESDIQTTFWIVNVLENYSWLIEYNPAKIYSY
ncbi:MAG: hypothetical protein ACFFKA_11070, partial [Candidatus Thorarchaeota archaeon]